MCRKNQLHGYVLIAFAIGVLIGTKLGCDFFVVCAAIGCGIFGCCKLLKK